jgi:creatinine amidohydrolase
MKQGLDVAWSEWRQIESRLRRGDRALLPIGAASKEHGWHLPAATDWLQAEWLRERLIAEYPVVAWPTVAYGYYPVFVEYPGSISLSERVFSEMLGEIIDGIFHGGADRLALLNTGISTIRPLELLLARHPCGDRCQLVNVYSGPAVASARAELEEQPWGGHADEFETSIMLALAPELVRLEAAVPPLQRIERGIFNRSDPDSPNYNPTGVNGDPTRATAAKGQVFLQAIHADVCAALGLAAV